MLSFAMEDVENAVHPTTAFPTSPTATAAAASITKDPQILRGRLILFYAIQRRARLAEAVVENAC